MVTTPLSGGPCNQFVDRSQAFQQYSAHSICTTSKPCTTLGALASVAGGARTHAGWAWLTGRRVAQVGDTPLHKAAQSSFEADIEALLAAKADVNAKNDVRGGKVAWRARGVRRGGSVLLLWSSVLTLRLLKDPIREPLPQPSARTPPHPRSVNSDPQTLNSCTLKSRPLLLNLTLLA